MIAGREKTEEIIKNERRNNIVQLTKMKITPKSEIEIKMENLLKECEDIVDDSYLKTQDARRIMDTGYLLLIRFEDIRKSRDNWRNKYEQLRKLIKTK